MSTRIIPAARPAAHLNAMFGKREPGGGRMVVLDAVLIGRVRGSSPRPPSFAVSILDLLHPLDGALADLVGQRGVIEAGSELFAVRIRPLQELHELFALVMVLLLRI